MPVVKAAEVPPSTERGTSAVEYSILAAAIAAIVAATVLLLGQTTARHFEQVSDNLVACTATPACT